MSSKPLYLKTAERLAHILSGMEPGNYLPSEPRLAKQLGVSRATLREAMRSFEQRGLVVRRQGVGTYVAEPPQIIETGLELLESIETLAARIDLEVEMGQLHVSQRPPLPSEEALFVLPPAGKLVEISRLILAKGRPVAYLIDILPQEMLPPDMLSEGFTGSVLDLLLGLGQPVLSHSRTEITAVAASADMAHKMEIQRGDVLLRFEASLYNESGQIVDRSESFFLPGTFRFRIIRRVGRSL